ncbi:hypothetical protein D210916BOD24_25020 [Alteromonas sp. D210916BOD_24]|uniref:WecB/TagA/CpsF family glycosyltransferase n=1 Tax=Alteromonas sp. D210916BOD_24 TaxID=3157618 RepID=UPI00399C4FF5
MTLSTHAIPHNITDVIGLPIDNVTLDDAAEQVIGTQRKFNINDNSSTRPSVYYFVNANSVNTCCKKPELTEVLMKADSLFADGIGMRIAAKKCGSELIDNVNGTDLLPKLCERAAKSGKRIFLFGAKPGVAEKAAKNLTKSHKGLKIAGTHHGFVSEDKMPSLIAKINKSKADILLVAMGTPIQEFWVEKYASSLDCQAVMAVGGLFDFFSGAIPRAPLIMRKYGLEWVFRLIQEPVTKFERYVLGVPEFLYHVYLENKRFSGVRP